MSHFDRDAPLFVPVEFTVAHEVEARRIVRGRQEPRSHVRRRSEARTVRAPRLSTLGDAMTVAHVVAAALACIFAIVTDTLLAGTIVVVAIAVSLFLSHRVRRLLEVTVARNRAASAAAEEQT